MTEMSRPGGQAWEPPDGLGYSRSREVRLTGNGIFVLTLAAVLALGGVAAGVALNSQARRQADTNRLLAERGAPADAVVTRRWRSSGKDAQTWITYRFSHAGAEYEKRVRAPRWIWNDLREGASLSVRFLPSDPAISHPQAWSGRTTPFWLPYFAGALMISMGGLLVWMVQRQTRLLAEGRPAQGMVTRRTRAGHGKTRNYYEFRLLNGSVMKGRAETRRPFALGETLCVLYDRDNPRRNAPYPLPLVRLERVRKPTIGGQPRNARFGV